jgi:hypothetical protein
MLCVVALFFNNNCPRIHELKQTHKNKYQVIFYIYIENTVKILLLLLLLLLLLA